jgi:hypothetical protein
MCDFDNPPMPDGSEKIERPKRSFTLHQRNVGKNGDVITHWSSGPGNYTYDPDCWWCRVKGYFGK